MWEIEPKLTQTIRTKISTVFAAPKYGLCVRFQYIRNWDWSESERKIPQLTPLPHMRLWLIYAKTNASPKTKSFWRINGLIYCDFEKFFEISSCKVFYSSRVFFRFWYEWPAAYCGKIFDFLSNRVVFFLQTFSWKFQISQKLSIRFS